METDQQPGVAVGFGYKCSWLAVRGVATERVIEAIRVRDPRPAGWPEGIEEAYEGAVFVSPPIDGWVLVVSTSLPDAGDSRHPDTITPFVVELSRRLETDVQYFSSHRVVEYHAWAWAERGRMVRAYAYLGEQGLTILDAGEKTPWEIELGHEFFDERSTEAASEGYFERTDLRFPNEEDVMRVASGWSIDPQSFDETAREVGPGWLGSL